MFDRETWRFINTFAPWLSALGTLIAVVVSLRIARRASRLDVRVFCAIVRVFTPGQPGPHPEFFQIRAVNHGGRDATINGVGWRLRGSRQNWLWLSPQDPHSTKLPVKLAFGEEAMVLYPTSAFNRQAESLLQRVNLAWYPPLTVASLRVGMFTSTGQQFFVPLSPPLRKFIRERAKQIADGGLGEV